MSEMIETGMLIEAIRPVIISMHDHIRHRIVSACEQVDSSTLAGAVAFEGGDTIYAIDRLSEGPIVDFLGEFARNVIPIVVVAEGLAGGALVLPAGASQQDARLRVIIDPIDGTRGIMYQKRSAWILTGVAPNRGNETGLRHLDLSVMTEIPLIKQHLSDQIWAVRGRGAHGIRTNRLTGKSSPLRLTPSTAAGIEHGYAGLARLVPGARDVLAAIEEELIFRVTGPQPEGVAICFEDQYTSTGGQMYELCAGRDRFLADLRPLTKKVSLSRGRTPGLCCHPYDLAGLVIAEEAGVIVTGADGEPLDAPLDTQTDVAWIGYANQSIRRAVEAHLLRLIDEFGLGDDDDGA
jgi:fructose-1,6-bisphosphatase/inositol monophosphatase family enzyme